MKLAKIIFYRLFYIIIILLGSCTNEPVETSNSINNNLIYKIKNDTIYRLDKVFNGNGVNTLNTFGISNHELINEWNIKVVREFIGNLREQPISGDAIKDSHGDYLHSLQSIVDANRDKKLITILCPFGWVDTTGTQILFTGLNPKSQVFFEDYKTKMRAIAEQFKNQPDVWIEVWNEPYHFNNENGYTHYLWLSNQIEMVDNLRTVEGFTNIIVVPGNEQGQSEAAILENGQKLLQNRYNIIFDIHAYEKWLINTSKSQIKTRIDIIHKSGISFLFGEVGVINTSGLMPVNDFLAATKETKTITLAWLFNRNTNDQNALLTDEGLENNTNNNNWGTTFKIFLTN
jgi:mannan endo-1,4-beta-mannosidase